MNKIIPQIESWIPHVESTLATNLTGDFKNLSLTFSPKPKLTDEFSTVGKFITAVSVRGTIRKILNKALLHNSKPEDIPTHVLTIGKGAYNDKAIDFDYTDIIPEYDSRDYKVPKIVYINSETSEYQTFLNGLNDNLDNIQKYVEDSFFGSVVETISEPVEEPVVKKTRKQKSV